MTADTKCVKCNNNFDRTYDDADYEGNAIYEYFFCPECGVKYYDKYVLASGREGVLDE